MTDGEPVTLRALMPEDGSAARALITERFAGTRYLARTLEQLEAALLFEDPEFLAVLAEHRAGTAVGLALFGTVAGARRCSKLHALTGDPHAMAALAAGVVQLCRDAGERLVICELADDPHFALAFTALLGASFVDEGRVADLVADGVDMRLLAWRA